MSSEKKYTIRVRIWIDEEEGSFLGKGRVVLLEKIKETGSITNAAKAINMSYRKAWQLIDNMSKSANTPLVKKILGGKNGSGTILTEAGERTIQEFNRIEQEIKSIVEEKSKDLKF